MSSDLQSDLTADLLRDLSGPSVAPAVAPAVAAAPRPPSTPPVRRGTPALAVTLTPLQWSRPSVRPASAGTGVALRGGPWQVELAF